MVSFDPVQGILCVFGDEDRSTAGRRRRALSSALAGRVDVIVDLQDLTFADASFMVDLAVLAQRLRRQGHQLRLRAPQPQVQRLIEAMGLDRLPAVALDAAL